MREIFSGVFEQEGKLFTKSFAPGTVVYGEKIIQSNGSEFRQWDFFRSKLAGAIKNGLQEMPIRQGSKVMYLGAAEGTTVSHVSDIVGGSGIVFGVDISERVMRKFITVAEQRPNIVPIIADAAKPWVYKEFTGSAKIDVLYQDVAQQGQAKIFLKNAEHFLEKGAAGMLVIKAKSISQQSNVAGVFEKEIAMLNELFKVKQVINLKPFEKDHAFVLCEKM